MGLLFYASPILRIDLSKYFRAISAYRNIAQKLQEDPTLWDTKLGTSLWPSSVPNLNEWIAEVLENKPTTPKTAEATFDTIIVVDASAWGWGAVKLSRSSGKVKQISKEWDKNTPFSRISTHAEPMALAMAACVFVDPDEDGNVLFLTDSKACLGAFRRGYSGVYTVNGAVDLLQKAHPRK